MLLGYTTIIIVIRGVQHYQCYYDAQTLAMLSGYTIIFINVIKGVQEPLPMLLGVYSLYQYYQGCTTFINIIMVQQCYQGCTSISILSGVYNNHYQCY